MWRILSTKKLLPGQKQYLLNAGLSVIEADFIAVRYKEFALDAVNQNLIFTSQNAVRSFSGHPESSRYTGKKVFCVGRNTKELAERTGFEVVAFTDYAAGLAEIITRDYSAESFTFFSGNLRRDMLPDALTKAGVVFNEIEVYETSLTPHKINAGINGILFFSPSGVQSYLTENSISGETCFCIGTTTAEALDRITENVVIANKPTIENTIIQCINYYKR